MMDESKGVRAGAVLALVALVALSIPAHAAPEAPLRFEDDLGAPVPGLEVCFQVDGARRCQEPDPAARLRWPVGATALWAAGPSHGPVWVERETPDGGTAGPEIAVPRKAELTVEGVPAGASLVFYRAGDRAFTVPLDRFRVLDPARRIFAPPGATVLAIRQRDRAPDLHRLDAPPGGSVRVRALQRDEAEGGRSVRIARTAQGDTFTDANGEYAMTVLADGDYLLSLHDPEVGSIAARPVRVGPGGTEASFRLEAVLAGRVVSSRAGVVGGAEISLAPAGGEWIDVQKTVTMSNGFFRLPVETAGTYRIGVAKEGWLGDGGEIRIGPDGAAWVGDGAEARAGEDGTDGEIELTLHPLERLRGRVVDGDGRPLPGVRIASCRDAPGSPLVYVGAAETGADGTFEIASGTPEGAPPPRHAPVRLYASGPGCPLTEVTVEPRDVTRGAADEEPPPAPPVTLRCDTPSAVLRAHVAFSNTHPLPGERVTLRRHGRVLPQQVVDGHLESLGLPRATAEDGHLLLVLAPGRWQLHRAGTSPNRIEAGDESALLGSVALDPWTVTDLYTGTGEP